eukprot:TRINITY_DN2473_c0_g1_i1.p2 TRINITY_DN2473_c0_g1~~TRINITY_DN2473_c0_g1_i1.p2  ORF type:complete len:116 (+),score=28.05 TRINITY_DN2473_c0_g1_i1:269-616(+)
MGEEEAMQPPQDPQLRGANKKWGESAPGRDERVERGEGKKQGRPSRIKHNKAAHSKMARHQRGKVKEGRGEWKGMRGGGSKEEEEEEEKKRRRRKRRKGGGEAKEKSKETQCRPY